MNVEIKQTEPMTVAFLPMRGPYSQIPGSFGRLYGWIQMNGLVAVGMPAGVYYTSPETTPEAEAVWELWAPVLEAVESTPDDIGVGVKRVEGMTVASVVHKGPYDSIGPAYAAMAEWIDESGYVVVGPPVELYMSDPNEVPPDETVTEIWFPVRAV